MKHLLPLFFFTILTFIFLYQTLLNGSLPIPTDLLVGHFHPWSDHTWMGREAGYPWKNFDINDALVQLIPWREFSISQLKLGQLPLWNPYNLAGTPHLANLPTASLYPLNIIFFILPFFPAWTLYLALQTILAGTFMFWFLKNTKCRFNGSALPVPLRTSSGNRNLSIQAAFFGALTFSFSSFIAMRWTYGITGHTWMWLPLVLLSIDKIFTTNIPKNQSTTTNYNFITTYLKKLQNRWTLLGIFSLSMMILAGYLQAIIYGYLIAISYFLFRTFEIYKWNFIRNWKLEIRNFNILFFTPLLLTAIQLLPFLETLLQSGRSSGIGTEYQNYFLPWKRFITLITPDFFGNPATHNFWEKSLAYNEGAIYIGLIPFIFALFAILNLANGFKPSQWFKHKINNHILFWTSILTLSLIFITDNPLSRLPYQLNLPLYSSLLPSRLTSVLTLSLSILAAYGFHLWQTNLANGSQLSQRFVYPKNIKPFNYLTILFILFLILLWEITIFAPRLFENPLANNLQTISLKNLILPTAYLLTTISVIFTTQLFLTFLKRGKMRSPLFIPKNKYLILHTSYFILLFTTAFDLLRQTLKFTPFTPPQLAHPPTESIQYLQNIDKPEPSRFMYTHPELFPPNVNLYYRLAMIDGYDSVHNQRTETLLQVLNGQTINLSSSNSSRVTFSGNYNSTSLNLFSPEYIFTLDEEISAIPPLTKGGQGGVNKSSLSDLDEPLKTINFKLILQEGKTRLYQNLSAYPRVYLTKDIHTLNHESAILQTILDFSSQGLKQAVIEQPIELSNQPLDDNSTAQIISYQPNQVIIETNSNTDALLVFNDTHAPGWNVRYSPSYQGGARGGHFDHQPIIYRTNYAFRGVKIPSGHHQITFTYQPKSFTIGKYISIGTLIILIITITIKLLPTSQLNTSKGR